MKDKNFQKIRVKINNLYAYDIYSEFTVFFMLIFFIFF